MTTTVTHTRTHVLVGFINPFLVCENKTCKQKVSYWHDPDKCGCTQSAYNSPCKHELGTISICPTWNPVEGCICTEENPHGKL